MKKLLIILLALSFTLLFIMCTPPPATPTFDPAEGDVAAGTTVTINCATPEVAIYYTTSTTGTAPLDPTTADTPYTAPIPININTIIKAIAVKGDMSSAVATATYNVVVATPVFNPVAGGVVYGTQIAITCPTAGASIRYTLDGTDPTETSTLYSASSKPQITADDTVIKAKAFKTGLSASAVASATYTLSNVTLTVEITGNGTVGVTVNGTPATGSSPYTIKSGSTVVLTATPGGTDQFLSWTGGASGIASPYTIEHISADTTVGALFGDPSTMATVILNVQMDWGDGSGYQMLLDADATAYGTSIPTTGPLTAGTIFTDAEYKIPANADYNLTTQNIIVYPNQGMVLVPAGTYDWCITNPTPGDQFWIAGNGRGNDLVLAGGTAYMFTVQALGTGDTTIMTSGDPDPALAVTYGAITINDESTTPQAIGEVMPGTPFSFTLTNTGMFPLTITNITFTDASGGALTMTPVTTPLTISGTPANLTFTTTGAVPNSGIIHIESNDATSPFEFRFSCVLVPPLTVPFSENFDSLTPPALPNFWTIEDIVGTSPHWTTYSGGTTGNALRYAFGTTGNISRVILREFNMSSTTADPILCFNLKQAPYSTPPRCEVVRVFIKIGAGDWTQLVEYNTPLANYTYQNVTLTGAAGQSSVYIAFEGQNYNALSAYVDDISIVEALNPDMDLVAGGSSVADGGTYTVAADATNGTVTNYTITVKNTGTATLNLTGTPNVVKDSGDTRIMILDQPAVSTLTPGGSTTFVLRYTGDGTTTVANANFSIANNDPDENPYNFTLSITPIVYTTVTIGTGTVVDQHLPMEPYYGYSYTQSIYLQSEIANAGTIRKIRYQYTGSVWTDAIVIYMGHTTKTEFTGVTDYVPVAELTEVYNGSFTSAAGWIEITLTTPFVYNNTDNLVIAVDENTAGYHSTGDDFYCTSVSGNRSVYYYQDGAPGPNPEAPTASNQNVSAYIPNIKLIFY